MTMRLLAATAALAVMATAVVGASGAAGAAAPSRIQPNLSKLAIAVAVPYQRSVPAFPLRIRGYALEGGAQRFTIRLFAGQGWQALEPVDQSTNSCSYYYWVVRWRVRNPDVVVKATAGDTALPPYTIERPAVRAASGGAGWISGRSCLSPGLRFDRAINGNASNLVDVDYEVQVWEYRPGI